MKKHYTLLLLLSLFQGYSQTITIPDSNFKARLLQASPENMIAMNAAEEYITIDANGNNEIEAEEALAVRQLNVNSAELTDEEKISNLTGIASFTNLTSLTCGDNLLASLDVSALNNLLELNFSDNQLTFLDLNGLTELNSLSGVNNLLEGILLPSPGSLNSIQLQNNQLSIIDASAQLQLHSFSVQNNQLQTLDLTGLQTLHLVQCSNNQLTSLLVNSDELYFLSCSNNLLTTLDLSHFGTGEMSSLSYFDCRYNQLTSLNIRNGIPHSVQQFNFNPTLQSICADEFEVAAIQNLVNQYGYTGCTVDSTCALGTGETTLTDFVIYPNPAHTILNIQPGQNMELHSAAVYNMLGQLIFTVSGPAAAIDISGLASGSYFLKINSDKGITNTKFVKN